MLKDPLFTGTLCTPLLLFTKVIGLYIKTDYNESKLSFVATRLPSFCQIVMDMMIQSHTNYGGKLVLMKDYVQISAQGKVDIGEITADMIPKRKETKLNRQTLPICSHSGIFSHCCSNKKESNPMRTSYTLMSVPDASRLVATIMDSICYSQNV